MLFRRYPYETAFVCSVYDLRVSVSADRVHPKTVGISLMARYIYNHPDFRVIFNDL
jgi:hypothetical protein